MSAGAASRLSPETRERVEVVQGSHADRVVVDMMVAKDHGIDKAVTRTPESTTTTSFREWCEDVPGPAVLA